MKPKKKSDILEKTYKLFPDRSPETIDNIINFFWKEGVYKDIENLTFFSLKIPKLGKFEFIRKNIDPLIERTSSVPEGDRNYEYSVYKLEKLLILREKLLKEYERLNKKRKIKEEYYKSVGEQMENS